MVGEKLVFIEKEVIDTLKQWNTQSDRQTEQYDKLLVQALLLCCVGAEDLESGNVGEGVEEFIKSIFFTSFLYCSQLYYDGFIRKI